MHAALASATRTTRVSLIITTQNRPASLDRVLGSVARQILVPDDILIADHSEDLAVEDVITSWFGSLPCPLKRYEASLSAGRGAASALNLAVRAARGEYLVFTEGDCVLHPRFMSDHVAHAATGSFVQGRRAAVRSRYVHRVSTRSFHPWIWFLRRRAYGFQQGIRRPWTAVRLNDYRRVHGCNFAAWRSDVIQANGFDEALDESGCEIIELAERLRNRGLTLKRITGQAIVYHLDHRRTERYRTGVNEKILERTRQEKLKRCEHGLAGAVVP